MNVYSFKINNGVVVDGKVNSEGCGAEWLTNLFGGVWVESNDLIPIGIGWTWDESNGFQPPQSPALPAE